jgi:23S rRNA pseudoU1915 N3-methylase RlmH
VPDDFDEEEQRELYEAIGNECVHRAQAIAGDTDTTTSLADARNNVRQALRELSAAIGEVEGLATSEMRLQAAFTLVAALFPHKEEL